MEKGKNPLKACWGWCISHKKTSITFLILTILIVGVVFLINQPKVYETLEVSKQELKKEVRISGKVIPLEDATLAFQAYGEIREVLVDIGDEVKEGDILALLERDDLAADVSQARADLLVEERTLTQLDEGTREEEVAVQDLKVQKAQQTVDDTYIAFIDILRQSYTVADDFVRSRADLVFDDPYGDPDVLPLSSDYLLRRDVSSRRKELNKMLDQWRSATRDLSIESFSNTIAVDIKENLYFVQDFADDLSQVVGDFQQTRSVTEQEIEGYQASISVGRSEIDAIIANMIKEEENVRVAKVNLLVEQQELTLKQAGPTYSDRQVQRAKIAARAAQLEAARSQDDQRVLKAPFTGLITDRMIELGDSVQAGEDAFTLVAKSGFEVETFIPEVFIAGVSEGDTATLEFDAYPGLIIKAIVTQTDPQATDRDSVATYRTLLQVTEKQSPADIRIGMTVDARIIADSQSDVLMVPMRSVMNIDSKLFVLKKEGEEYTKVEVQLADRDSSGNRKVVSGLRDGDVILQNPKEYND